MSADQEPNTLDREAIEQALRESERRYRDLIEGSIQGVLVHVDGKSVFANQAYADIFGYDSPEELLKQESARDHIAPHERDRMAGYTQARLRGEDIPAYEFEGVKKDGSRIWLENRGRAITWEGKPAIQRTVVDITERKQAQERLRAAEEQNRLILESAGEGIYGLDLEGKATFVNPAAARMLGYEVEELVGEPMHDLVHHAYPDGTRYSREKCPMYAAFTD
ncbi:MAG TPA: PAS domain S-box protein, partial [Gammaproteobacteria bacterium]|nr:PAS domain S-box protein [Gammaproteobacteria bacterium]